MNPLVPKLADIRCLGHVINLIAKAFLSGLSISFDIDDIHAESSQVITSTQIEQSKYFSVTYCFLILYRGLQQPSHQSSTSYCSYSQLYTAQKGNHSRKEGSRPKRSPRAKPR